MEPENSKVLTTLSLFDTKPSQAPSSSSNKNKKKKLRHVTPQFISPSAQVKASKNKLQTGCLIHLKKLSEIYNYFSEAQWHPILWLPTRKVLPNMVAEFYCNMGIGAGVNNVVYLTYVVCGRPILIDHLILGKVLKLSPKIMSLPNKDITKDFVFTKEEYTMILSSFCSGVKIPSNVFNEDNGVSFEHFLPIYQLLALIMRANVFLWQCNTKMMSFVELKLMYKIVTNCVDFSLPYLIILKMLASSKMHFMPYAMLLTALFDFLGLDTNQFPSFNVSSTISSLTKRTIIPLPFIKDSAESPPPGFGSCSSPLESYATLDNFRLLINKIGDFELNLRVLQDQLNELSAKYDQTVLKVDLILTVLSTAVARAGVFEQNLAQLIQVQGRLVDGPQDPNPGHVAEQVMMKDIEVADDVVDNPEGLNNVD